MKKWLNMFVISCMVPIALFTHWLLITKIRSDVVRPIKIETFWQELLAFVTIIMLVVFSIIFVGSAVKGCWNYYKKDKVKKDQKEENKEIEKEIEIVQEFIFERPVYVREERIEDKDKKYYKESFKGSLLESPAWQISILVLFLGLVIGIITASMYTWAQVGVVEPDEFQSVTYSKFFPPVLSNGKRPSCPQGGKEKLINHYYCLTKENVELVQIDKKATTIKVYFFDKNLKPLMVEGWDFAFTNHANALRDRGINVEFAPAVVADGGFWSSWWSSLIAIALAIALLFVIWRRFFEGGSGGSNTFTKGRVRLIDKDKVKDRFSDVAGLEEIKAELLEIMHSIEPEPEFEELEIRLPKGILLHGPPGTGKTLMARAVAGEIDIPFFNISGPDFVEMYVGVGAARMRDTFKKARENSPCVLYIDEIDAVGKQRMSAQSGGDSEYNQTVTQFLIELDGLEVEIEEGKEVVLIASTNRFEDLDKALSDRFELKLEIWLPDENEREAIFRVHGKNKISESVDFKLLAEATEGFAGREISQIVKRAAVLARRRIKREGLLKRVSKGWKAKIEQQDLINAHDEVSMGVERKSKKVLPEEERDIAYHEAGHALVAKLVATEFRIPKVSVVPRIKAGGFAWALMAKKEFYSEKQLLDRLAVMMGGRAAEKIILGARTMGVGGDLAFATDLVESMVCRWGMSKIGPINLLKGRQASHGGRTHGHGDAVGTMIFEAKIKWLQKAYEYALKIIFENNDSLHKIAHVLVQEKTISGERIDEVLADPDYPSNCLIEGWTMPSIEKVLQEVFEEMKEEIQLLGKE